MSVGLELPNPWRGSGVCSWTYSLTFTQLGWQTDWRHTCTYFSESISSSFHWSEYFTFTLLNFHNTEYIVWIGQWCHACNVVINAMVASQSQSVINRSLCTAIINNCILLWLTLTATYVNVHLYPSTSMWAYYKSINILCVFAVWLCAVCIYVCVR